MGIFSFIVQSLLGSSAWLVLRSRKRKKIIWRSKSLWPKLTVAQRKHAKLYLSTRIDELSKLYDLPFAKLSIRDQKSRRWSCSSKKNISLNRRLYLMPVEVSDYVIIHELVHTVHMNHGKDFRAMVGDLCPDYKKHMLWLKKNGVGLM
jgi:predicted metal-dependent hydrolase